MSTLCTMQCVTKMPSYIIGESQNKPDDATTAYCERSNDFAQTYYILCMYFPCVFNIFICFIMDMLESSLYVFK